MMNRYLLRPDLISGILLLLHTEDLGNFGLALVSVFPDILYSLVYMHKYYSILHAKSIRTFVQQVDYSISSKKVLILQLICCIIRFELNSSSCCCYTEIAPRILQGAILANEQECHLTLCFQILIWRCVKPSPAENNSGEPS